MSDFPAAARISVVVPLYNGSAFVAEALRSIAAQTYPVAEAIVVDDGSTDDGPAIARTFPIATVVAQPNGGCARALNTGVRRATGEFLAFLDADDRWLPEKTARQMAVLEGEDAPDLVFCGCRRFHSRGQGAARVETTIDLLPGLSKTCLLIRRTAFDRVGLFPTDGRSHDFVDWFARATETGLRHRMIETVLAERRVHDRNHGVTNTDRQRRTYFAALKASLDRRRAQQ